ncbi:MAG: amino acid adenylation domain-containing protein, partial [Acidobacteriota bacterium]
KAVVEYDTDLYERETAKRMMGHYERILEAIVQPTKACVGELSLLSEQERRQLLRQWNETEEAYPQLTLPELFERQVERTPERIAVEFGEEQVSYQQLNRRANQLAHYLRKLGVGPEVVVAIMMDRSVETILSVLGVLKAGGAYMLLDPEYPSERRLFMLADSSAQVVLTQQSLCERLPEQKAQVLCLDAHWPTIAGESKANPVSGVTADNLAYIIYTSGSTGRPKGVAMPHRPLVNLLVFQLHNSDASNPPRTLQFASLSFDVSFQEIFSTCCAGATLVLIDEEVRRDAKALWQVLVEKDTARLFLPFVALQQLAEVVEAEETVPSHLREVITAGEQLKITREIRLMFEKLAGCTLDNQYGPSETHVASAWQLPGTPNEWPHLPPIGRPITNTQTYVLDEWLQPVPIGVVGDLYIGGECLARGYLDRPEQTAEKFIPHPFSEAGGERLYKTGDLARYLNNGCLDFAGRSDHQLKVRGFRIEVGEIEFALKQLAAVKQAIVHAWEDSTGQKRLAAYVVAAPEALLSTAELRNHLREMLPEYMIPSAFILLAELPLTPSGKVDRRALSAPDSLRSETEQSYAAPRTPIEEVLASVWANLLGFEKVGINDNFFELGGHSLLATRLMSQITDAFQIDLALRQIFEHPTVAELAQSIEKVMRGWQKSPLPPVTLTTRAGAIPLSFAQQRLWFLDQMEPGNSFYNISSALGLNGPLDHSALERSLAEIIRRHEVLRTTFQMSGEGPVQIIASEPYFNLPVIDLSALQEAERELEAQVLAAAGAARPFDLSAGPLLRATLLRLSAEEHILLLTMHHIISDGWSLGQMVKEVATLYQAFRHELPSPLPELEIQYADYALWQRQQLSGALLDEQLTYWREQLQSAPAVLALPTDKPRPAVKRYRGAQETFHISEELALTLKALSRAQRVTMFMLLLAAFKVLMWRYSGQEDIVVGTPIANRQESQIEDLVGFFVNTLAVRTRLEPTERFADLVKRVREECLAGYQHQAVPFELVVEELAVERTLSYTPIFQVMFVLQNELLVPREMEDLKIKVMEIEGRTAKVDLLMAIAAQEAGGGLRGVIEYDTDLFEQETVRRLAQHYQILLQGIVSKGDERIGKLPLLGEEERQRILVTWNETKAEYPAQSVSELFEAVVERTPEKVAVLFEEQAVSYEDLNRRANQLGHHLRKLGVGPEVVVAVLAERSVETIVSLLAVLKAGGAYLPLEVATPPERLLFMMEDSGVKLLLTQQRLLGRLPAHRVPVVLLDADWRLISSESEQNLSATGITPEHLAYLMYTSGSTGKPKGIGIPHRAVVRLVSGANYANLSADEVVLQAAPISFDASTFEIWGSLLNGGRLVLLPAERASLEELGRALKQHQVTTLWLTAGLFHLMVEERAEDLQGLRQLLAGGDVLSVSHVERALRELEGCQIINGYGPTENTTFTCCYPMTSVSQVGATVSIGRPISNTKVYLLDANLQPVPVGVTGELYIGGDGLARGYFNHPSLTAEKFIPDPFNPESGGRLYKSGDLARYLSDGKIEFLGRMDHQVKIRGFRIEPSEIQTVLAEHPAVAQSVVLVRADGEREKSLLAYVVAEQAVSVGELRTYLQARLPEYMIPTAFVMLSGIPLTPHGKVDRSALLALESSQPDSTAVYVDARTFVEEMLVGIWANLLEVQRVGIYDNFFELGGHSLLAVRLLSRVRESFEVEVTLHSLFETPTVAGLAEEIERRLRAGQASLAMRIVPAQREGKLALSFSQQRLWFLNQLQPGSAVYNLPIALRLNGLLKVGALEQSVGEIVRRHETLRTTFVVSEGEPWQVITPPLSLFQPVVDLSALAETERESEMQRLMAEEARRPFDLAHGPLLRANLLRLAEDEHVALFTMHHIISDGWSMAVLVQEIVTLYQAFSRGQPLLLPELPVQYADFAKSQREWLQGEVLEEQLSYWREQLSGAPAVLGLPTDHVRPAMKSHRGARERLELSAELTVALKALSREQGVTLFMVMLAAFKVLMWRYSGQADVVVGTPIANRQQSEIEELIGFFVNTLALRTRIEGSESFTDLLKRVREVCLGAYQHQDVPFEMVVEEMAVERALSHTPIFQVMFVLQNAPQSELLLEDVEISVLGVESGTAKFDLTLTLIEDEGGLSGQVEYDTDLFAAASIKRMVGHFQRLLQEIVRDGEQAIGAVPMLGAEERQQLLLEWNQTTAATPDSCLHQLFEAQVEQSADAVAVVFEEEQLSYGELNQ